MRVCGYVRFFADDHGTGFYRCDLDHAHPGGHRFFMTSPLPIAATPMITVLSHHRLRPPRSTR